jgi:hypothetical protein
MGWTFVRQTRDQLIRELLAPQASERACCEVIDHTLDGDVLWTVVRVTARQAGVMGLAAGESVCYIGCHLLESSGGDWGYKSLDESVHPYYYSCPLRYLDMAPVQSPSGASGFTASTRDALSSGTHLPSPNRGEHGPAGCGCSFISRGHHHACTFFRETAVPHRRMPRPHGRRLRR